MYVEDLTYNGWYAKKTQPNQTDLNTWCYIIICIKNIHLTL